MPVHLSQEEKDQLKSLRTLRRERRARGKPAEKRLTAGQIMADRVAQIVGSWPFILIQAFLLGLWITLNIVAWITHWDPYPFILLNLVLSFQAAFTAPIIMMSQNRQAEIDRQEAHLDFDVNRKAELEIEALHEKVDLMREQEINRLLTIVEKLSADMAELGRTALQEKKDDTETRSR